MYQIGRPRGRRLVVTRPRRISLSRVPLFPSIRLPVLSLSFLRHARVPGLFALIAVCALGACRTAAPRSEPSLTAGVRSADNSASRTSPNDLPAVEPLATFDTAWAIIERTHWDTAYNGVDWNALRDSLRPRAAAAGTQGELRRVLMQMVSSLNQSHFSIIPQEISDVAIGGTQNASAARDAQVGLTVRWINNAVVVTAVESGSAADRAGVRSGWIVRTVEQDSIADIVRRLPGDMDPRRVALTAFSLSENGLRGASGTTVNASFIDHAGAVQTRALQREALPGQLVKFGNLPPQLSQLDWERREVDGKTLGVISFNIWMPVLVREFDIAMDSLRNSDGIIIDVRGNFGGVGGMSMGIAGHFVDTVIPVGLMKTRAQEIKFAINPRRVNTANQRVTPFAGPVAIVVDELSISTTEIFAGGMQSLSRARIIGSQTAGQALPAVAERLPNGDILYHAIANFLSPSGASIEGDGVFPDERIVLTKESLRDGRDPALEAALRWAANAPPPGPVTGPRITP